MRKILFFIILITRLTPAYTQQKMDLEDLIKNNLVNQWVDSNMEINEPTMLQKVMEMHPFLFYNTNRKLAKHFKPVTCFGIELYDAYAYRDETNQFALFLLLKGESTIVKQMIAKLGFPRNVDEEMLKTGDFSFLFWELDGGIDVFFSRNRSANEVHEVKSQLIFEVFSLEIYNMPHEALNPQKGIEDEER